MIGGAFKEEVHLGVPQISLIEIDKSWLIGKHPPSSLPLGCLESTKKNSRLAATVVVRLDQEHEPVEVIFFLDCASITLSRMGTANSCNQGQLLLVECDQPHSARWNHSHMDQQPINWIS